MILPVRILGTGSALPASCVTGSDLDARLHVPEGTCAARNGVRTRHIASPDETASVLATIAVNCALDAAGVKVSQLDALLYAGIVSEQPLPPTAVLIHQRLRCARRDVVCFDINASCAGFLKATEIAASAIATGVWQKVAIVAADIASKAMDWSDIDTCTLFGDGAAAAILGASGTESSAFLSSDTMTLSEGFDLCSIRGGGSRFNPNSPPPDPSYYHFKMNGRGLLRLTQAHLPKFLAGLLQRAGVSEVTLVVPHQASPIGLAYLKRLVNAPVIDILGEVGNQVSASLPFTLDRAVRDGRLQRGESALLIGTAAGLVITGMVLRF